MIRVVLADDHTLFRDGLRSLLERQGDVSIIAATGNGPEALEMIERLEPDIALLDISMPGLSGLAVALRARRAAPRTHIVILTMHAREEYVTQALQAGVKAYLLKGSASTELVLALRAVMRGETWLSPDISSQVVGGFLQKPAPETDPLSGLKPRQREVLQLIAEGKVNKEIAADLNLSIKTVESHRAQLMDHLGIRDVPGLVRLAVRAGLVSSER